MPMHDENGEIIRWIGTCTDIHLAKQHASQNEILSRELSHRIKNIFAVIGGLIGLSARNEPGQKQFARQLQERIAALGRAHEFVRPHSSHSAPHQFPELLHGVIREILAPYPALAEGRISIDGDDVSVDDRGATPMALLVHELATNATKYGALSAPEGRVKITTRKLGETLELRWEESGGPQVKGPPEQSGFGTMLSQLSIVQQLGGTIDREWLPGGLVVTARVQLSRLVRSTK
jgi:two-component sensor histidine kinase